MTSRTGSRLCFPLLFLLCSLRISLTPARLLKDCTVVYSNNVTDGVSVHCMYLNLESVPEGIPADATSLALDWNRIRKINGTDFYHLSNLRYLVLSNNAIDQVDDGAFDRLTELEVLYMDCNQLTTLTDRFFRGLSNLLQLRLEDNHITFFNPAAFCFLPSLQELSVTSNQITDIIPVLQLPRLQVLEISIETYESFQSKDLPLNTSSELRELRVISSSLNLFSITTAAFPHLETIDLSWCCADYGWEWDIPDKSFLRNVTKVYFSDNDMSFKSIGKALQSFDSLEYLELSEISMFTDILDVVIIACDNIPTLSTLILRGNRIESLNDELSSCTRLSELDLSDNRLSQLSNGSLRQMTHMSRLNLALNYLSKVPGDIKLLSMLRMLNLTHNFISDLSCSDFSDLNKLTHLHLDNNQISVLKQCVFKHLSELKALTVKSNLIGTFGDTFRAGLQKLELLDLGNNIVSGLREGDLSRLKSLKHLDVELNSEYFEVLCLEGLDELETFSLKMINFPDKVTSSPSCEFPLLPNLKVFRMQFILVTGSFDFGIFSNILRYMPQLEQLTVEHANVVDTPGTETFDDVPQLRTLTLRSDALTHLDAETFDPVPNLEALDLSDNNLKSLDFLVRANLTRVSRLDLSRNELTVVNASVFRFLPALRYVNMAGNPFSCDCSNVDFQQWILSNNQTLVVDAQDYRCAYPLAKKGSRFLDFDYRSCWVDASFVCYVSSTCVVVLTLLTSFTYHFLRLHLLYGYYLFLAFLYDAKERKRGSPQRYDAFISYNVHDELWVYREMLPVLEGEQGWRLCLHHRDFIPGSPIIENITDAIYGSRKIICVISHHYLESEWCSKEMQMASYRLFDEQKDVLILVFLEDIPAHQLSPYYHVRRLVKRHTYLSWSLQAGQQHPGLFWQNLRRALEDTRRPPHTDLGLNE